MHLPERRIVRSGWALELDQALVWVVVGSQVDLISTHYVKFAETASEAITQQGVRRVIWISTLGRDTSREAGHYSAALAADKPLEASGADYRILRPAVYMDNLLWQVDPIKNKRVFFLSNAADQQHFSVATRDIAATAAALLLDSTWSGRESVLTDAEYKANMMATGANSVWAQGLADMAAAENDGFYASEPDTAGRTATDFRQWCEEVLKPAVLG